MVSAATVLSHETAIAQSKEIADQTLAPVAGANDKVGRFSREAVEALGRAGLLGLTLKADGAGNHLSTLAFSEAGSRSHFWAPVSRARRNGAGVHITANKSWVTSAGQAHSYVVSALAPDGAGPTDSTLYLLPSATPGLSVAGAWDGLGMRANASAPMMLEDCELAPGLQLTDDGAGFK